MIEVIPAIIPESFDDLAKNIERVRRHVSRVQVDVMDMKFAPQATWPYNDSGEFRKIVAKQRGLPFWEDVNFEIDMMVEKPEHFISEWITAGATALIIHVESSLLTDQIILKLRKEGIEIGLALVPSSSNEEVYGYLGAIDFVQFMGNDRIGYHGVELNEKVIQKIKDLRERNDRVTIAVDIGVNEETAPRLVEAGANKLVSGSAIFNSENLEETIKKLQELG